MRLHHGLYEVHLPVTDVDRSIDFYVEKLGFGERGGVSALLTYTAENIPWMLGLFRVDTIVHREAAEYHVSFRVVERNADMMIPYLLERGIEPVHPPTAPVQGAMNEPIVHGWMPAAAVFFKDPDGHLLELIAELAETPRPDVFYCPLSKWRNLLRNAAL